MNDFRISNKLSKQKRKKKKLNKLTRLEYKQFEFPNVCILFNKVIVCRKHEVPAFVGSTKSSCLFQNIENFLRRYLEKRQKKKGVNSQQINLTLNKVYVEMKHCLNLFT